MPAGLYFAVVYFFLTALNNSSYSNYWLLIFWLFLQQLSLLWLIVTG